MTIRHFGTVGGASAALALALAAVPFVPAAAQDADTPAPAPSRPIDFRLPPPTPDGRTPGVQGPADNGLPPLAPGERLGQPVSRPAPTPAPTPAPQPAPPRVAPTQPGTAAPGRAQAAPPREQPAVPPPASAAAPAVDTAPLPSSSAVSDAAPGFSEAPPPVAESASPPADDGAPLPVAPAGGDGTPVWAWLLAALAAGAAGFWYWRRRPAFAGDAPAERTAPAAADSGPPAPPPAPRSPVPAPRPPSPLVTRPTAERRAQVSMALEVKAIRVTAEHVAVAFALNLANKGSADATGLMVRIALNQGSAMPEPVLARFFDGAGGSVLRDDMAIGAGADEALTTEAMLPRAMIEPLIIGGKPMLVPVMAFDVTYHWEGDADAFGQVAGSFVLGRERGTSGSEKLAPLPLDRAAYQVDRPGARSTAVQRVQ
ncbi:MAG TPA: hypothetical protein PKD99_07270 [Sphingopyxis sp.]|nr:hypothetical protein [Sphingopyxis sp.]HMP44890.1 hypothetical protein [Sphingopyxis sp.]HMQ19513.1 hypothetical protein [Sphingopyxis sp.]